MNKIKIAILSGLLIAVAGSCSEDYLELTPKGQTLTTNYYQNEDEAFSGLVAAYDLMRKYSGGFDNIATFMGSGSDDQLAGGGSATDGVGIHAMTDFSISPYSVPESFWSDFYQGIFRANILLQKLPTTTMDDSTKSRFTAEAKSLRALYYFNLVILFKNVPLLTEPLSTSEIYNVTQASSDDVYAQIEKDLAEAISNLPSSVPADENGRITQGAAKALLGKVYLYNNKKTEAAQILSEVNGTPGQTSPYGYKLLSNFADLWKTDNKFNSESILEVVHTNQGNTYWGISYGSKDEGNMINTMVGPRGYVKKSDDAPNLPSGWSFAVFTQNFYDAIKDDPRFSATVLDLKTMQSEGKVDYLAGYQDTGYFVNKFTPRQSDVSTLGGDAVLNYRQDFYVIRLADTYLMEAEALGGTGARAQALLDAVRARVGLPSITVSLDAIKKERRLELAGEGQRFFDLVRWGDAASVLSSRGFVSGKNEILPIPYTELRNTKMVQNPGY